MTNIQSFLMPLASRMASGEDLVIVIVTSDEPKLVDYREIIRRELKQREVAYRLASRIKSVVGQA